MSRLPPPATFAEGQRLVYGLLAAVQLLELAALLAPVPGLDFLDDPAHWSIRLASQP